MQIELTDELVEKALSEILQWAGRDIWEETFKPIAPEDDIEGILESQRQINLQYVKALLYQVLTVEHQPEQPS